MVYDFTHFKISRMISKLQKYNRNHPDLEALEDILEYYEAGDIDIFWEGGYPMPDIPDFDY